jgi:hypothetical protein
LQSSSFDQPATPDILLVFHHAPLKYTPPMKTVAHTAAA